MILNMFLTLMLIVAFNCSVESIVFLFLTTINPWFLENRYICVCNKHIMTWFARPYELYSLVWNISLTRSLRSLVREMFQTLQGPGQGHVGK